MVSSKLFAENSDSLRILLEYASMMFLLLSSEELSFLFSRERVTIAELNVFHEKFNTLSMPEKIIISLFRAAMNCDGFVEDFQSARTNSANSYRTRKSHRRNTHK